LFDQQAIEKQPCSTIVDMRLMSYWGLLPAYVFRRWIS